MLPPSTMVATLTLMVLATPPLTFIVALPALINSRLYHGNLRLWYGPGSKPYVEVKNKNKTKKE